MRPHSGLAARLLAIGAIAMAAVAPAHALAQGPVAAPTGAFCTLITSEDASAAFGYQLQLTDISGDRGESCTWSGVDQGLVELLANLYPGTMQENKDFYEDPDGFRDITVGGQPGLLLVYDQTGTGTHTGLIFTLALDGVLQFDWTDKAGESDVDIGAALTQVMEAALPRMSSITFALPTPPPVLQADPELAAMFPTTIGGEPVQLRTFMFIDVLASIGSDPEGQAMIDRLTEILASQGRTLEDVSLGSSFSPVTIGAVRIRGGDAKPVVDVMGPLLASSLASPVFAPGQVAGRDVTIATGADGGTTYFLTSGEVLWYFTAEEPVLSEIITALP